MRGYFFQITTGEEGVAYHDGENPKEIERTTLAEWRSWAKGKRVFARWRDREKA